MTNGTCVAGERQNRPTRHPPPGMDTEEIKRRIIELQIEHRDLDEAIARMAQQSGADELQLRRLKKRKLQIRDAMTLLQMRLVPDIPA
jgi:hypothetical protein